MAGSGFRSLITLVVVAGYAAAADDPPSGPRDTGREAPSSGSSDKTNSQPAIAKAVARLGEERFEIRDQATRELGRAGAEAIEPLRRAAEGENLEVTWRAVAALGRILDTDDESTFDAAEGALERLEASANRSAARRAATALDSQAVRRWQRGLARFEAAGGWAVLRKVPDQPGLSPMQHQEILVPAYFVIGPDWRTGAAGLVNVRRIDSALQALRITDRRLGVYVVDGCDAAPQALDEMQHSLRLLEFMSRGRARLAISFSFDFRGRASEISSIEPDAAATTRSNLKVGDVIVTYDGETLTDFDHLTRVTRKHDVGDRIRVEVRRNGESVETEVELTGWKKPDPRPREK